MIFFIKPANVFTKLKWGVMGVSHGLIIMMFAFTFSDELEYMQRNGFGALKCLHGRTYFLKNPTECFDEEVGSHSQIMKAAGINIH